MVWVFYLALPVDRSDTIDGIELCHYDLQEGLDRIPIPSIVSLRSTGRAR
jgi:hypothetical protein